MQAQFARPHVTWSLLIAVLVALFLGVLGEASSALAANPLVAESSTADSVARRCFQGASPRCPNRIVFRRGATSARVFGRLFGIRDKRYFVLHARAGQHMRVTITGAGPTRGIVTSPSGQQNGQPGGLIFDEDLTETGDYLIQVSESLMGEAWVGDFRLDISIH